MLPVLAAAVLAQAAPEASLARVRQMAYARLDRGGAIAADPEIVAAVQAKNASGESLELVHARDAEWVANRRFPLRKELTQNACAKRLRELTAPDDLIVEAFAMDRQGALVCATVETSDYWQGDEAKWQRTFEAGAATFLDQPALDVSTGVYAVQLSLLIKDGPSKIGALTLTLKLRLGPGPPASASPPAGAPRP